MNEELPDFPWPDDMPEWPADIPAVELEKPTYSNPGQPLKIVVKGPDRDSLADFLGQVAGSLRSGLKSGKRGKNLSWWEIPTDSRGE